MRDGSLPAVLPADRRPGAGARANLFGMTETFGPYCGARLDTDLPPQKRGSCGRPFEGVEVRIVDPGTGRELAPGEDGEIWLRGDHLMRGICGRLRSEVFNADGSYRTGDLGRVDDDGYLWYAGRLDDMVKVKGATVYPSEVEAALRSIGEVMQAFVTDVPDAAGRPEIAALVITDAPLEVVRGAVKGRLERVQGADALAGEGRARRRAAAGVGQGGQGRAAAAPGHRGVRGGGMKTTASCRASPFEGAERLGPMTMLEPVLEPERWSTT